MLRVHSMESFWTHEGPGIRFVLFLQWCMFKCLYCHNPDTISFTWGNEISIEEITKKVLQVKPYFGKKWGFTVSWWEPLLQSKELIRLFEELKSKWIHIAVDTNWFIWNDDVKKVIELTDLFLVDIKHIDSKKHKEITTKPNTNTLKFIDYLESQNKDMWIRYVLVPWYTDQTRYIEQIGERFWNHKHIKRIEILPYHHLWVYKWEALWWEYKLKNVWYPSWENIEQTKAIFEKYFKKVLVR